MVRLIIGGRAAGKRDYVKSLGYRDDDFSADFSTPILYKLNDFLQEILDAGADFDACLEDKLRGGMVDVIICDEVGCGVVPMDAKDRAYREAVGRACKKLAQNSDIVERVFCGIATRIKG